ncbi:hypothetical protein [Sphingomonas jatrophae]|uniref:hypothetical protein n=1 Tax=Sphingomonas jatrophae TaxID=1166337 RepID=UPI0013F4CC7B|nr:hypothetical protein [Sphingomonas jatrophae]
MMWINQQGGEGGGNVKATMRVPAPAPHQGVGDALRTAYLPRGHDLPADIVDMLTRLR